jgi:hypothetical protein
MDTLEDAIGCLKRAVLMQDDATATFSTRILAALAVAYHLNGDEDNTRRYWNMVLERDMRYAEMQVLQHVFGWTNALAEKASAMIMTIENEDES